MIDMRPIKHKKRSVPQDFQHDKKDVIFCMKRKRGEQPSNIFGLQDDDLIKKLYETRKLQRLDLDWLS